MTAPRIVPADEARVLREAATPGPWRKSDEWNVMVTAGARYPVISAGLSSMGWPVPHAKREDTALIAAAPDLAATVEALHAEVARLRALVREAYREGFAASDEMGWHSDDSASETRWLASAARAALEVTP